MNGEDEQQLLDRVHDRLGGWTYAAREQAYEEYFEGPNAVVTAEERRRLDDIDEELTRRGDGGLWGIDEYDIAETGEADGHFRVVCTHHPEIPYDGFRGTRSLDEATREEFNDLLWDYCERVVDHLQDRLDELVQAHGESPVGS
jgi:hypothetical protein